MDRCQMDAIEEGEDVSKIIDGRCIGCGLCVSTCPEEAISLVVKPDTIAPPKNFLSDTLIKVKTDRELLAAVQ